MIAVQWVDGPKGTASFALLFRDLFLDFLLPERLSALAEHAKDYEAFHLPATGKLKRIVVPFRELLPQVLDAIQNNALMNVPIVEIPCIALGKSLAMQHELCDSLFCNTPLIARLPFSG